VNTQVEGKEIVMCGVCGKAYAGQARKRGQLAVGYGGMVQSGGVAGKGAVMRCWWERGQGGPSGDQR